MGALLDLPLKDSGSLRLVEAGDLEDLRGVEPAVCLSSHDRDALAGKFINRHGAGGEREVSHEGAVEGSGDAYLYVAL